jgi:hypothetical protein
VALAFTAQSRIAVQSSGIGGLLKALRGPMPDFLILLVILHGAETADRRANRVHFAVTGVITAYAAGLRIDGAVGWWMLAWSITAIAALCTTETRLPPHWNGRWEGAPVGERPSRRAPRIAVWSAAGLIGTIASPPSFPFQTVLRAWGCQRSSTTTHSSTKMVRSWARTATLKALTQGLRAAKHSAKPAGRPASRTRSTHRFVANSATRSRYTYAHPSQHSGAAKPSPTLTAAFGGSPKMSNRSP